MLRSLFLILSLMTAPVAAAPIPSDAPLFDGEIGAVANTTYDIGGNRLALLSLRRAGPGDVLSRSVFDGFTTSNVLGIYAGTGLERLSITLDEFTDISDGIQVPPDAQVRGNSPTRNAIWVLWEGAEDAIFVTRRNNGRAIEVIVSAQVSLSGTPIDVAVVPLPAPFWLLLSGLAGLGLAARVRRTNRARTDRIGPATGNTGRPGRLTGLLAVLSLCAAPAIAAPVPPDAQPYDAGLVVDQRGGVAQVYDLGGERLGLLGLRWAEDDHWLSASIFDGLTNQTVIGLYAGPGLAALDTAISEFTDISDGYRLEDAGGGRIWGAVWVRWSGTGNAVFTSTRPDGRRSTATLTGTVSLTGTPVLRPASAGATAVVPLPAPAWLLLTGLVGLALAGRRQRRATS
ncbi:MAG: VPLPA-CTERM sorting domain-containing protein [Pseudomonadota bacterium]